MSLMDLFSERNILNSVATQLSENLLDAGYLVYWHALDAVQTPDGMYGTYSTDYATHLADGTFAGRVNAALGMVTVTEGETASPRFPTRLTTAGEPTTAERVQVPTFGIEIGPEVPLTPYEHGSYLRWRVRPLTIEGRLRTRAELTWFTDKLAQWFDEDFPIVIEDHDNSSGEDPSIVRITRRLVTRDVVENLGEQDRFQVQLQARLEFVA